MITAMDAATPRKTIDARHTGHQPHLLREVMRTHQVLMGGFPRAVGMPASRVALIRLLANLTQSEVGVMDLARQLGVNAAAITRQVKQMEAEGLVLRRPDVRDGRRSYLKLSARGLRAFDTIHRRGHQLENVLSNVIGADEMAAAAAVLVKVREVIEQLRSQAPIGIPATDRRKGRR